MSEQTIYIRELISERDLALNEVRRWKAAFEAALDECLAATDFGGCLCGHFDRCEHGQESGEIRRRIARIKLRFIRPASRLIQKTVSDSAEILRGLEDGD